MWLQPPSLAVNAPQPGHGRLRARELTPRNIRVAPRGVAAIRSEDRLTHLEGTANFGDRPDGPRRPFDAAPAPALSTCVAAPPPRRQGGAGRLGVREVVRDAALEAARVALYLRRAPVSTEPPRPSRVDTRLPRNIRVPAAAPPRLVSRGISASQPRRRRVVSPTEYPRPSQPRHRRDSSPRNIHVPAPPRRVSRGISASQP